MRLFSKRVAPYAFALPFFFQPFGAGQVSSPPPTGGPIKHIVFIMQENHSFDNDLGALGLQTPTGNSTNGSNIVTNISINTSNFHVGDYWTRGGFAPYTTITSIDSATQIHVSTNALSVGPGTSVTFQTQTVDGVANFPNESIETGGCATQSVSPQPVGAGAGVGNVPYSLSHFAMSVSGTAGTISSTGFRKGTSTMTGDNSLGVPGSGSQLAITDYGAGHVTAGTTLTAGSGTTGSSFVLSNNLGTVAAEPMTAAQAGWDGRTCVQLYHNVSDVGYGGPHNLDYAQYDIDDGLPTTQGWFGAPQALFDGVLEAALNTGATAGTGGTNNAGGVQNIYNQDINVSLYEAATLYEPASYHTAAELPTLYTLAANGVVFDHMFSPQRTWSLVAHQYAMTMWGAIAGSGQQSNPNPNTFTFTGNVTNSGSATVKETITSTSINPLLSGIAVSNLLSDTAGCIPANTQIGGANVTGSTGYVPFTSSTVIMNTAATCAATGDTITATAPNAQTGQDNSYPLGEGSNVLPANGIEMYPWVGVDALMDYFVAADGPNPSSNVTCNHLHASGPPWCYREYVGDGKEPDATDLSMNASYANTAYPPIGVNSGYAGHWNIMGELTRVTNGGQFPSTAVAGSLPTPYYTDHIVNTDQLLVDAKNCTLPALSYMIPNGDGSEHPMARLTVGQMRVAAYVNAIQNSTCTDNGVSYWKDTLVFVVYDDWGGYADHVAPPNIDVNPVTVTDPIFGTTKQANYEGYGIRVAAVLVGGLVTPGKVDHNYYSFDHIITTAENLFAGGQRVDPSNSTLNEGSAVNDDCRDPALAGTGTNGGCNSTHTPLRETQTAITTASDYRGTGNITLGDPSCNGSAACGNCATVTGGIAGNLFCNDVLTTNSVTSFVVDTHTPAGLLVACGQPSTGTTLTNWTPGINGVATSNTGTYAPYSKVWPIQCSPTPTTETITWFPLGYYATNFTCSTYGSGPHFQCMTGYSYKVYRNGVDITASTSAGTSPVAETTVCTPLICTVTYTPGASSAGAEVDYQVQAVNASIGVTSNLSAVFPVAE